MGPVLKAMLPVVVFATGASGVVTSPILAFWPNAGGAAMAGAMTGRASGPSAGFWNPGGLGFCSGTEVAISAREMQPWEWYGHGSAVFGIRLGNEQARRLNLGAAVTMMNFEFEDVHDERGNVVGSYRPWDGVFRVQAGMRVIEQFSVGASFGYFYRMIVPDWVAERAGSGHLQGGESARAFTAGAGVLWQVSPSFSAGLALTDFGSDVVFTSSSVPDPLPTTVRLGARFVVLRSEQIALEVLPEFSLVLPDRTASLIDELWKAVGIELTAWNMLAFRVGFQHAPAWNRTGLCYGLGFNHRDIVVFEISDDRYLYDLGSRWWTLSITVKNIPELIRGLGGS